MLLVLKYLTTYSIHIDSNIKVINLPNRCRQLEFDG